MEKEKFVFNKNRLGLALIELIVVLTVAGLLFAGAFGMYNSIVKSHNSEISTDSNFLTNKENEKDLHKTAMFTIKGLLIFFLLYTLLHWAFFLNEDESPVSVETLEDISSRAIKESNFIENESLPIEGEKAKDQSNKENIYEDLKKGKRKINV